VTDGIDSSLARQNRPLAIRPWPPWFRAAMQHGRGLRLSLRLEPHASWNRWNYLGGEEVLPRSPTARGRRADGLGCRVL